MELLTREEIDEAIYLESCDDTVVEFYALLEYAKREVYDRDFLIITQIQEPDLRAEYITNSAMTYILDNPLIWFDAEDYAKAQEIHQKTKPSTDYDKIARSAIFFMHLVNGRRKNFVRDNSSSLDQDAKFAKAIRFITQEAVDNLED